MDGREMTAPCLIIDGEFLTLCRLISYAMKLSSGQKKELKGMLTLLIASIVLWVIASLLLHFPWEHTVVLTCIALVISIFQTAFIVFRPGKKDQ